MHTTLPFSDYVIFEWAIWFKQHHSHIEHIRRTFCKGFSATTKSIEAVRGDNAIHSISELQMSQSVREHETDKCQQIEWNGNRQKSAQRTTAWRHLSQHIFRSNGLINTLTRTRSRVYPFKDDRILHVYRWLLMRLSKCDAKNQPTHFEIMSQYYFDSPCRVHVCSLFLVVGYEIFLRCWLPHIGFIVGVALVVSVFALLLLLVRFEQSLDANNRDTPHFSLTHAHTHTHWIIRLRFNRNYQWA